MWGSNVVPFSEFSKIGNGKEMGAEICLVKMGAREWEHALLHMLVIIVDM